MIAFACGRGMCVCAYATFSSYKISLHNGGILFEWTSRNETIKYQIIFNNSFIRAHINELHELQANNMRTETGRKVKETRLETIILYDERNGKSTRNFMCENSIIVDSSISKYRWDVTSWRMLLKAWMAIAVNSKPKLFFVTFVCFELMVFFFLMIQENRNRKNQHKKWKRNKFCWSSPRKSYRTASFTA